MFSSLLLGFTFMGKVLFTHPIIFFQVIKDYIIDNKILGHYKTISITIDDITLYGPNEHGFFYTAIEVFQWKLYHKLTGCHHILDLGGYLGESAVRLSQQNTFVTVVEPNDNNYRYITQNTHPYDNITALHGAIVYQNTQPLYYSGDDYSAGGKITTIPTDRKVQQIDIEKVFSSDIDGVKIDIEGGEYDIISYLMTGKFLQLKKGYIEFHDIGNHRDMIDNFIQMLEDNTYLTQYEDIYGTDITKEKFNSQNIAVLYFSR